ncbi:MAG: PAS domain S-box protein [Candidatus Rokubacteria bacterium]|nr:PAS domain S-box protein [Candidatus Rokubacteria bacterium]
MMAADERERRKRNLITIGVILVLIVAAMVVEVGIKAPQLPIANNIVVFALFNLNLVVFLLLLVLLFRNLIKLSFERRHRVLGSRFKTKLVVAFLSLGLAPSILIFLIASNLINTSIEGWFKVQVERPLDESLEVARTFYESMEANALRHAERVARVISREGLLSPDRREALIDFLLDHQEQYGLAAISIYTPDGKELVHVQDPVLPAAVTTQAVNPGQVRQSLDGQEFSTVAEIEEGDLIQGLIPILTPQGDRQPIGAVVVAYHVPQRLEARVRGISKAFQEYKQLKLLKDPIKGSYILLFLLMTLIIVFSVTWFGLYLAKGITVPIQLLAEGTREVAVGNLNYKVDVQADDDIGILVDSFNKMTQDLAGSKANLEQANLDLQKKNWELEQRRRYTETVLEAVATGVVSVDEAGRLTTVNRAAARILGVEPEALLGRPYGEALGEFPEMSALIHRVAELRAGGLERELEIRKAGGRLTLLANLTVLRGQDNRYLGQVLVFDDLTELLKAQRLAAWREVAQRIAHEIKNPLTPIQLSAQRLRRRLAEGPPGERKLLEECTGTIIEEVEGLRRLVDEFSRFARMPTLSPRPTEVDKVVESLLALYAESHPEVKLRTDLAPDLPPIVVDPDQLKRALVNLVDNAIDAVNGNGAGEILIQTAWDSRKRRARIAVVDTGIGIPPQDREKLFLPYFSTKATGMGLGLSIVQQIMADHGGQIWVEENQPRGSRFVLELPAETLVSPEARQ